jgi:hypothetical protein
MPETRCTYAVWGRGKAVVVIKSEFLAHLDVAYGLGHETQGSLEWDQLHLLSSKRITRMTQLTQQLGAQS